MSEKCFCHITLNDGTVLAVKDKEAREGIKALAERYNEHYRDYTEFEADIVDHDNRITDLEADMEENQTAIVKHNNRITALEEKEPSTGGAPLYKHLVQVIIDHNEWGIGVLSLKGVIYNRSSDPINEEYFNTIDKKNEFFLTAGIMFINANEEGSSIANGSPYFIVQRDVEKLFIPFFNFMENNTDVLVFNPGEYTLAVTEDVVTEVT